VNSPQPTVPHIPQGETQGFSFTEDAISAAKTVLYVEGGLVLAIMLIAFAVFSFEDFGSTDFRTVTTDISATLFKRD
jgi:hypothetical protein